MHMKSIFRKRILITGGSGFIGTNLCNSLKHQDCEICNLDIIQPRDISNYDTWVKGDVRSYYDLEKIVINFKPNFVIHLAAKTDLDGKCIEEYSANYEGNRNVVRACAKVKDALEQIQFFSSRLVCEIGYLPVTEEDYKPTTLYGESKVLGEKIIREEQKNIPCPWIILRPTSIWGPWFDTPYKEFFYTILRSLYIHPKGSEVLKSFGYVGNTIAQIEKIIDYLPNEYHGKTIYLSDYEPIKVLDWGRLIAHYANVHPPREVPLGVLKMIAKVGDILKTIGISKPPLTTFRLNNILTDMVYDTSPLKKICGPLPYSQEEGIIHTLSWINSNDK